MQVMFTEPNTMEEVEQRLGDLVKAQHELEEENANLKQSRG